MVFSDFLAFDDGLQVGPDFYLDLVHRVEPEDSFLVSVFVP